MPIRATMEGLRKAHKHRSDTTTMTRVRTIIMSLRTTMYYALRKTILTAMSKIPLLLLLIIFVGTSSSPAADALVRLEADPESPWVGQKVVLKLDVLGADGWAQLQKTGDAEIQGGYLLRLESQGTRLNEVVEGVSYSGQRYEFLFFAQRDGTVTIPEMAIDVEVKTWGADSDTETIRLMTPSLDLTVKLPPGAEQLEGLISTTEFSATQNWTPSPDNLSVGDALIRDIALSANDVTGMAFMPISPSETAGIRTYLSQPTVEDSYNRGTLVGKRQEKLTYVFEEAGSYTLPDLSYNWWNSGDEKLQTITLAGLSVEVQGGTAERSAGSVQNTEEFSFKSLLWVLALIIISAVAVYRYRTTVVSRVTAWQRAYYESEKNYFKKIKSAAQRGDYEAVMSATMQWLDRLATEQEPARLDRFLSRYSDASGRMVYDELVSRNYGEAESPQLLRFFDVLATARSRWRRERRIKKKTEQLLPQVGLSTSSSNETMDEM